MVLITPSFLLTLPRAFSHGCRLYYLTRGALLHFDLYLGVGVNTFWCCVNTAIARYVLCKHRGVTATSRNCWSTTKSDTPVLPEHPRFYSVSNPDRYVYTENASKNSYGANACQEQIHSTVSESGNRRHVYIQDTYFSPEALEKDIFYVQPVEVSTPWYRAIAIRKNTLGKMVKEICVDTSISG